MTPGARLGRASSCLCAIGALVLGFGSNGARAEPAHVLLVDRHAVEERLRAYSGTNSERAARLKQMFVDAGCGGHLVEQPVRFARSPNLVCVLPGTSGRVIIVGAHFDRVSGSPGVADNWSGASLLPTLYASVNVEPRRHTFIFIGFTDEEQGLIGSRFYARHMTVEEVAATAAMINLDTPGLAPAEVWASRADPRLVGALNGVAKALELELKGVNFETAGYSTDSESFRKRKIPSMTIHSLTQESENRRILHSSRDNLTAMNLDYYDDTYRLVAMYLVFLDRYLDADEASPPATISRTDP